MGRKKAANADEMLTEIIMLRVTKATWDKLENIRSKSDCQTIPEVVRRIIGREKIIFFHKDASMDAPMEILIGIQKELKAIGVNINQITRNFNSMAGERQRWYQIKRAAQYYNQVDTKVNLLLTLISQLAKKWLQK
ncbi:MAG: mobC [Mucilaginibacter sp.]|nr:mobC [Mucilaginibacter sp.]